MHQTQTARSVAQQTTTSNREAAAEQVVIDQIMQPFMGNQDWANLVAPSFNGDPDAPKGNWLPGDEFQTASFLSGLT